MVESNPPSRRKWRRVAVGLPLLAASLAWWQIDNMEVSGASMEPMFVGGHEHPDRLAVVRPSLAGNSPQRFDLVVFDRPELAAEASLPSEMAGDLFIKRVLAVSGEDVLIDEGDVFVAPDADSPLYRVMKPMKVIRDLLTTVDRLDFADPSPWLLPTGATVVADHLIVDARGTKPEAAMIYTDRITFDDADLGEVWVNDTGVAFSLRADSVDAAVAVMLVEKGDTFQLDLSTEVVAGIESRFMDSPADGGNVETFANDGVSRLRVGEEVHVTFLNVDNQLLLLIDDELVMRVTYERNSPVLGTWSNAPSIVVKQGVVAISDVVVVRDGYYTRAGEFGTLSRYRVPAGEYFLLGDNSHHSRDSRHYGAVPHERFRGRPWFRYAPFVRRRWLW